MKNNLPLLRIWCSLSVILTIWTKSELLLLNLEQEAWTMSHIEVVGRHDRTPNIKMHTSPCEGVPITGLCGANTSLYFISWKKRVLFIKEGKKKHGCSHALCLCPFSFLLYAYSSVPSIASFYSASNYYFLVFFCCSSICHFFFSFFHLFHLLFCCYSSDHMFSDDVQFHFLLLFFSSMLLAWSLADFIFLVAVTSTLLILYRVYSLLCYFVQHLVFNFVFNDYVLRKVMPLFYFRCFVGSGIKTKKNYVLRTTITKPIWVQYIGSEPRG